MGRLSVLCTDGGPVKLARPPSAFAVSLQKEAPHVRLFTQACVGVTSFSNNPQRGLPPAAKALGFLTAKPSSISGALCLEARAHYEVLSY